MANPSVRRQTVNPSDPFTRAEARTAGITVRELRGPRYQRVFYNLYVSSNVLVTAVLRARAALKVSPGQSHASHFTAAEIWGGCVPEESKTHVSSLRDTSRCQRRGIRNHDINPAVPVVRHRGTPVTHPVYTFIELATELSLVDLVVLGDSLVRARRVTPQQLIDAADGWKSGGRPLARRAARLVREGVDSPMESRLRMLIVLAGLPEPEVNLIIRNQRGDWHMRFDLSYPDLKLVIEYDGRQHAENDDQWDHDINRREDLDRMGWRIVIVRSKGIYGEPGRTLRRIVNAMRERGARGQPRLCEEWQQYFPGRR